jgi:hypothetical protein
MVISSQSPDLCQEWAFLCFPILIPCIGLPVCMLTSFVATHLWTVKRQADIEPT